MLPFLQNAQMSAASTSRIFLSFPSCLSLFFFSLCFCSSGVGDAYPCNPSATVPAKSNPPCGLERLEELVWLEERPDKQGVSDAQGQQQEENVRRPPSLLVPLAATAVGPRGSTPRLWHRSAREKEATTRLATSVSLPWPAEELSEQRREFN